MDHAHQTTSEPSRTLASLILALVACTAACDGGERQVAGTQTDPTVTATSTTGTGGSGGSGGGPGVGGGGGGDQIPPADIACEGDFAFRAVGMTFTTPTPQDLGLAFNELSYDPAEHPITVVLRSGDAADVQVGASATMENENGTHSFATGLEPTFIEGELAQGSFGTVSAQPTGYLRLRHLVGFLDLELANLDIYAATTASCGQALVLLDAVVPAAERDKTLELESGETTVGDLAGGDSTMDIPLHAVFAAESINFDFASL